MNLSSTYRDHVRFLASRSSEAYVLNGMSEHASALFETLFDFTKEQLVLICRNLASVVFEAPAVIDSMQRCLERGIKVRILLETSPPESVSFEKIARTAFENGMDIELRILNPNSLPGCNFAVSDKKAFRFEENPNQMKAVASFNQTELALKLQRVFETCWKDAQSLPGFNLQKTSQEGMHA